MIVASETIALRFHKPEDAAVIFENYSSDIQSAKYLARPPHTEIIQTENMLQKFSRPESLSETGKLIWVIEAENIAAGLITVVRIDETAVIHFGIGLPYRGRGYASAAVRLAANYLTNEGYATSVSSFTDVENRAAQAVLMKAGFELIGKAQSGYRAP